MKESKTNRSRTLFMGLCIFIVFALPGLLTGIGLDSTNATLLCLTPLVILAIFILGKKNGNMTFSPVSEIQTISYVLLGILILISFIRTESAVASVAQASANNLFILNIYNAIIISIILWIYSTSDEVSRVSIFENALFSSLTIICVLEIILPFLGRENIQAPFIPQTRVPALFLTALGYPANRYLMPIASGMHNALVFPVMLFCLSWVRLKAKATYFSIFGLSLGMLLLLLVDARSYITAPIISILLFRIFRTSPKALSWIAVFIPLTLPLFVLNKEAAPALISFATGRYETFGLFSGREVIWDAFWSWIETGQTIKIILGNGIFGQYYSGISTDFNYIFGDYANNTRELASVHNGYFQIILDAGLAGLFFYCLLLKNCIKFLTVNAAQGVQKSYLYEAFAVFLISVQIIGNSEAIQMVYSKEGFVTIVLIISFVTFFGGRDKEFKPA